MTKIAHVRRRGPGRRSEGGGAREEAREGPRRRGPGRRGIWLRREWGRGNGWVESAVLSAINFIDYAMISILFFVWKLLSPYSERSCSALRTFFFFFFENSCTTLGFSSAYEKRYLWSRHIGVTRLSK